MPVKEKEPKYKPFTQEEKDYIIRRHKELVDDMNKYLPDEQKLQYDKNLAKSLDDEKTIAIHRVGEQVREARLKQEQILEDLRARFGRSQQRPDPLSRTIVFALNPKDDDAAKAYNEKIYQDYLNDPGKVIYMRYKKILNFNPKKLIECGDDKLKLAEFYRDNYPLCDEAFAFSSVLSHDEYVTPEMKKSLTSVAKPIEVLGYPQTIVKASHDLDYFACPKLTMEQSVLIQNTDRELMNGISDPLRFAIMQPVVEATMKTPDEYFKQFTDDHQKLEKGFLIKRRPEKVTLDANHNPVVEEILYDHYFSKDVTGEKRVAERPENQKFQMECMTKSFQREYLDIWQKTLYNKLDKTGNFNIDNLIKEHRGGFMERYILRNTSPEYKAFRDALKEYNDPQSPNYMNDTNLRDRTNAYLAHKGVHSAEDLQNLSGTSFNRSKLALGVLATLDDKQIIAGTVEEKWNDEYQVEVAKEPFLTAEEVDEKGVDVEKVAEELNLENDLEFDNDLDNSF